MPEVKTTKQTPDEYLCQTIVDREALPLENIATVDNRGFEIDTGFHKQLTPELGLDISGNFSWNKNKIVFMDEPESAVSWQRLTGHAYGAVLAYYL
ncbi:hypothetical protein [uncultured Proteiniphilum sp.]|uniref:hypothetical protein n=1 Tax=uncultured Proteiniphilum sp. TaxID=497637 RepID=UPI00261E689B|nr:hypothetical protein [uncultured Proteiniphilum sp.]